MGTKFEVEHCHAYYDVSHYACCLREVREPEPQAVQEAQSGAKQISASLDILRAV